MGTNFLEQFGVAMELGRKQGDGHYKYIKAIYSLLETIFDSELELELRILALHKLGITDNKIDTNPKVAGHFRLLNNELASQKILKSSFQWQYLDESITRCDRHIEEIARLISPTNMDIQAREDEQVSTPETIASDVL